METDQGRLLKDVTLFLGREKIPYMITGAWSVIYYGRPRASHDIDFIVEVGKDDADRVVALFEKLSSEFLLQPEQIRRAIDEESMFNILHLPSTLKLDFWILGKDLFNKTRFSRRKRVKILNQYMFMATAEDTILKKLLWYKNSKIEKHLIDAAFVYQIQGETLDVQYLKAWAKKQKTERMLRRLKTIDLEQYY